MSDGKVVGGLMRICSRSMFGLVAVFGAVVMLDGCLLMRSSRIRDLKNRAAFEFRCPKDQIATQKLGGWKTQGVSGCGRRGVYLWDDHQEVWVFNSSEDG